MQVYFLSRNYGHQLALTCGLDNACGDAVITMDGDLQHPPELVPELLKLWEDGFQIVQTVRTATEDASFFKNITSLFLKTLRQRLIIKLLIPCPKWKLHPAAAISA